MVLFCLGSCGGCLGGVMVLGMSFYVMMWVLVMGCVVGGVVIDDAGLGLGWWMECPVFGGGVLSHARLVVGLAG